VSTRSYGEERERVFVCVCERERAHEMR
jgi:hypothetical protein